MKFDEAKEGDIACFYAEKSFLKVKQAFGIDRICFSFVKKGSKGEGINIYMPIDEFDLLCDKILNYSLYKKIAEEKQKNVEFPGAYTCIVGNAGTKKICIGAGKNKAADAVCIQGTIQAEKNKNTNMFIGTTYKDLVIMAKWWQRCSKPYFDSLVDAIYKASMRKPSKEELAEMNEKPEPTQKTTGTQTSETAGNKNIDNEKPAVSGNENPVQEVKLLSVTNTTPLEPLKNKTGYACKIEKGGKTLPPIVFYNNTCSDAKNAEAFNKLKQRIEEGNVCFSIICSLTKIGNKDAYEFIRFVQ